MSYDFSCQYKMIGFFMLLNICFQLFHQSEFRFVIEGIKTSFLKYCLLHLYLNYSLPICVVSCKMNPAYSGKWLVM